MGDGCGRFAAVCRILRVSFCLFIVALAGCSVNKPLPEIVLPPIEDPLPVERLWVRWFVAENHPFRSSLKMAHDADRLYWATPDGDLYALDLKNGRQIWHHRRLGVLTAGVGIDGDYLFVGSREGEVIAVRKTDGHEVWRKTLSSEVIARPRGFNDIVFTQTTDGWLYALNRNDGEIRWRRETKVPLLTLRGAASPAFYQEKVIFGLANGRLIALSVWDGTVSWEVTVAAPRGRSELERIVDVDVDPVVRDSTVYAAAFQGRLVAVDARSGRILWARELSSSHGLAADALAVYVTDDDNAVWAFDRRSGATLWKQDNLNPLTVTAPVTVDRFVVVADDRGMIHWLSREDGREVARFRVDETPVDVEPVVVGDVIYAYCRGGVVDALSLRVPFSEAVER